LKRVAALASSANIYVSSRIDSHVVYQTLGQSLSMSIDVLIARVMGTKSRKLAGARLLIGLIKQKVTPTLPEQIKGTADVSHFTVPFGITFHVFDMAIMSMAASTAQHATALRISRRARIVHT
jgi:hypothetical protein